MHTEVITLKENIQEEQIQKLAYLFGIKVKTPCEIDIARGEDTKVMIRSFSKGDLTNSILLINNLVAKIIQSERITKYNTVPIHIIGKQTDVKYTSDQDLLNSNLISFSPTMGNYALIGDSLKIYQYIENKMKNYAKKLNATLFQCEPLWKKTSTSKIGYGACSNFLMQLSDDRKESYFFVQNAVCTNIYAHLENQTLTEKRIYKTKGVCSRNEGSSHRHFEYMNAFTMSEIVMLGNKDECEDFRNNALEYAKNIIKDLKLSAEIVEANDPFFMEGGKNKGYELPDIAKYEVRAFKNREKSLSCMSLNLHGTFFGEGMNIKNKDGRKIWSSCFAMGLERLTWAFLLQHGPDSQNWPKLDE